MFMYRCTESVELNKKGVCFDEIMYCDVGVSITNKKFVIDIDVFCPASQLFVRSWELPEGKRKILKVIGGGSGTGEVRLYKKIKKNLELIEHAHVAMALCQFGKTEDPEQ